MACAAFRFVGIAEPHQNLYVSREHSFFLKSMSWFEGLKYHLLATGYQNIWMLFAHNILHTAGCRRGWAKSEASGAIYWKADLQELHFTTVPSVTLGQDTHYMFSQDRLLLHSAQTKHYAYFILYRVFLKHSAQKEHSVHNLRRYSALTVTETCTECQHSAQYYTECTTHKHSGQINTCMY
jgi:hypothetical protein